MAGKGTDNSFSSERFPEMRQGRRYVPWKDLCCADTPELGRDLHPGHGHLCTYERVAGCGQTPASGESRCTGGVWDEALACEVNMYQPLGA